MSFRDYLLHGWKLCAIRPGFKGPTGEAAKGWQTREKAIEDPTMGSALAGAGLLHAWSGTCALDIDNFEKAEKWLAERGVDLAALTTARSSVHISSGRPGRDKLLYRLATPLPSKKLGAYKVWSDEHQKEVTYHAFELRCGNTNSESVQDVLPPTIHPQTGRSYEWAYGDDILGDWRVLPPIPDTLLALWHSEIEVSPDVGPAAPSGATHPEIEALLAQQDPDCDYDTWVKIGAAVHHETQGSSAGFFLWNAWSARGKKYKNQADLAPHWQSFRRDAKNPITLGSLKRAAVAELADFPIAEPAAPAVSDPAGYAPTVTAPGSSLEDWARVKEILEPRLVFVRGQDSYFDMASHGENYLTDRGVRHLFCPLMPTITEVDDKGKPKSIKPDPVIYLQNSRSKQVVDAVGLNPGAPRLYEEDRRRYVNRYFPEKVEMLQPLPHETEAFLYLWNRMTDPVFPKWLMKFYAHALQKPGIKITSAPLVYSAETGTGKNTICKVIPELLFGQRWVRTMTGNVLGGQFNDTLGETWWLYLEELRAGSTKLERTHVTNKIKAWVTDNTLEVHPKGMKPFDIRNRIQITATSNFDDALQLDNNDRRWAVCELHDPIPEREAVDLYHFLNSERAPGVLRKIFMDVNLTGFNPAARAPSTVAKVTMIRAGIGMWESAIIEKMCAGLPPFHRDLFTLQEVYEEMQGRNGPPSTHAIRSLVTKSPFNALQLPNGSKHRYYAWRNIALWSGCPESQRTRYMETGQRPLHIKSWSDEIPSGLINLSSDAPPEKPLCDLI